MDASGVASASFLVSSRDWKGKRQVQAASHDHVSLRAAIRARAGMLWTCSGRESLESHQAAQR